MSDEFVTVDPQEVIDALVSLYKSTYNQITGKNITLSGSDPEMIFLNAVALYIVQILNKQNYIAKQNFLRFAEGNHLDLIGEGRDVIRQQAKSASVYVRFVYSHVLTGVQTIPAGTRVTAGDNVYFQTTESITIPVGISESDVRMYCMTEGSAGNDYEVGSLNILVDPLPWVAEVRNIENPSGGSNEEDDDLYRERIRLSPEGYSVAGPELAYVYRTKEYDPNLLDVKVISPEPGMVNVCVLGVDGSIPGQSELDSLKVYLGQKDKRPLTDHVITSAPVEISYDVKLTYYIGANTINQTQLKSEIEKAVQDYILWQRSRIGRDIDPSELIRIVKNAGASRVAVVSPQHTSVDDLNIAVARTIDVGFGGIEDE